MSTAGAGSAVVTKYAVDGWNPAKPTPIGTENFDVWADLDGTGSLTTRYIHDDAVDALFARIDQSGGTVLDAITYDGFGRIASETNSSYRGRYAWTGRELDAEIDLQYNRARYYDSATGRWISQDPLGFDAGDGNLYRYSKNRDTTSTDPSGLINLDFQFASNLLKQTLNQMPNSGVMETTWVLRASITHQKYKIGLLYGILPGP